MALLQLLAFFFFLSFFLTVSMALASFFVSAFFVMVLRVGLYQGKARGWNGPYCFMKMKSLKELLVSLYY